MATKHAKKNRKASKPKAPRRATSGNRSPAAPKKKAPPARAASRPKAAAKAKPARAKAAAKPKAARPKPAARKAPKAKAAPKKAVRKAPKAKAAPKRRPAPVKAAPARKKAAAPARKGAAKKAAPKKSAARAPKALKKALKAARRPAPAKALKGKKAPPARKSAGGRDLRVARAASAGLARAKKGRGAPASVRRPARELSPPRAAAPARRTAAPARRAGAMAGRRAAAPAPRPVKEREVRQAVPRGIKPGKKAARDVRQALARRPAAPPAPPVAKGKPGARRPAVVPPPPAKAPVAAKAGKGAPAPGAAKAVVGKGAAGRRAPAPEIKAPPGKAALKAIEAARPAGKAPKGQPAVEKRSAKESGRPSAPIRRPDVRQSPPRPALREPPRIAPIPLPTIAPPKRLTMEERFTIIERRLAEQTEDFRKRYSDSFLMSWIYHDAALEGVVYTFEELRSGLSATPPPAGDTGLQPTYDDIRRTREAVEYIKDMADKKRLPITVDVIKKLYLILHPEEGDIKTVKYRKDIPQHRLYFHEYAPPDKIAYKVRQIVDWLNDPETRKTRNLIRIAARVHYDLLRVYPFPTDSGKVARLFMNLMLMRGGLPPAIIHSTERQRYYEALKGSANTVLQMVQEAVENSLASVEKLLDEHESKKRAFVS